MNNKLPPVAPQITYCGGFFAPTRLTFSAASKQKINRAKKAQPEYQSDADREALAAAEAKRARRAAKRATQ